MEDYDDYPRKPWRPPFDIPQESHWGTKNPRRASRSRTPNHVKSYRDEVPRNYSPPRQQRGSYKQYSDSR
jgi:hypothetical protein